MTGKITYTPFISKPIPESFALSPIPISFPISKYREVNPDKEVVPIQHTLPEIESEIDVETDSEVEENSNPFQWARLILQQAPEINPTETTTVTNSETNDGEKLVTETKQPAKIYSDKKKFKSDLKAAYEKELSARGISTEYADYIVAQDALESGWGTSSLSEYYNFGGVKETRKGKGIKKKTKESYDGKTLTDTVDSFRQFDSLDDYVKYKIDLLGNSNYNVFAYRPDQMYNRLVTAKNRYATDPDYEKKMNAVYKTYLAV